MLAQRRGLRIVLPVVNVGQAVGQQITPRLTSRQVAAGERHRRQSAQAFTLPVIHTQALAAPQRAVFPHADTVEDHGNHIAAIQRPAVFRQAGGGMSMVMQDALNRQRQRGRPLRRTVARMRIADHQTGGKAINRLHQTPRLMPLLFYAFIAEVAEVLTHYRLLSARQTKGIFHIGAEAQQRRHVVKPRR